VVDPLPGNDRHGESASVIALAQGEMQIFDIAGKLVLERERQHLAQAGCIGRG
jgi:hypothetical protein